MDETKGYWAQSRPGRLSRRRMLQGTSLAGAGLAAMAIGCGQKQSAGGGASGTTASRSGASETPKPGGTLHAPLAGTSSGTPPTLDPYSVGAGNIVQETSGYHYGRLLMFEAGPGIDPIDYTKISGDGAEKWEQVDPQTYVFHLRSNLKFHNVPPVNGRAVTADDIQFSNKRQSEDALNKVSWTNIVDKLETPDDHTAKFTLKQIYSPFVNLCAEPQHLRIVPKEMISANLQERPIGTGPFIFEKLEKDVAITWRKNPDYHLTGKPYIDRWEAQLVGDPSTIVANLKTGAYDMSTGLSASIYDTVKSEAPDAIINAWPNIVINCVYFNYDNKPWNDIRVRQALSLAIDRDGILKALDPTGKAGYQTAIGQMTPWWLDPKSSSFGPNAKYFKRDLAEAKKLLAAAGFPNGIDAKLTYSPFYGKAQEQNFQLVATTAKDAGFRFSMIGQEYAAYQRTTLHGQIPDGAGLGPLYKTTDPDDLLFSVYHPTSTRKNWSGSGPDTLASDSKLLQMFDQQQKELDFQKRLALVQEIQRYMAEKMYLVPFPIPATMSVHRSRLKGFYDRDTNAKGTEMGINYWLDKA